MSRSVPRIILCSMLCVIMAVPANLFAQEGTSGIPPVTIRANTRLVMVDVVVTDKKGQPVTGLKADDFTVEENGKKQKIAIFTPPSGTSGVKTSAPPPGILSNHVENVSPEVAPTVLMIDALNSPFKDQAYARSEMLKYVVEQSRPGRQMAVVALTDRVHVLQQFTSDPQILLTAIRNFRPQEPILQPAPTPPGSTVPTDMSGPGSHVTGSQVADLITAAQFEVASFTNLQIGYDLERRTVISIEAMRSLSRILGGLQGRKNVVWLTAYMPFDLIPEDRAMSDAELLADLPAQGRQRSVNVNAGGSLAAEQRTLHNQEIRDAESRLASASIAIYPVDLHGLISGQETLAAVSGAHGNDIHGATLANAALAQSSNLVASQGSMREVAAETGGRAYFNQNEIRQGISLASADNQASYTLGYYPENKKWDGKYRSLRVKVAQGDTEVRHRKGYFALDPGAAKNVNFEQDVAAALGINAPATQVSFMAQAKPTDPGKIRVVFLVDAHTISAEEAGGNRKLNVSLYASLYDSKGKNLETRSLKVDRAFDSATYQQILDKGMMVPIDMDVAAGAQELRLAVLDNKTGFIGTVSGPVGQ
jgi:VWFA-related protein